MGVWDFPINDINKNKNGESCLYDLYALSNHYSGGHYTAHAKVGRLIALTIYSDESFG